MLGLWSGYTGTGAVVGLHKGNGGAELGLVRLYTRAVMGVH